VTDTIRWDDRVASTLVDPEWLWRHRDDPKVLALGSSYEGFALGHVPGAVLPVHAWLKDTPLGTEMISTAEFVRAMDCVGVNEQTTVVVYDDFDGTLAARTWWMLRYHGHRDVRFLDGGWHRWVMEERALSQEERVPGNGHFVSSPRPEMVCSTDALLEFLGTGAATVVDVRPRDHWEGTDPNYFGNKRRGRIPGAAHLDAAALITEDLRTIRPNDELRLLLSSAGIPEERGVVFYCQAGVAATMGVLVLHLLGRDDGVVYEASMAEWANRDDTPLECDADEAAQFSSPAQ
jgi:thiosulfate/3-mercaptopyruvate sulfurtransferase